MPCHFLSVLASNLYKVRAMMISSHLEKISQCEKVMALLDPEQDFELWFWAVMVGGTNAVNAGLHHVGLTIEETSFPSQPGVFFLPEGNGYIQAADRIADILHVGRPAVQGNIPIGLQAMMNAMEVIERYRDPCTRGEMAITADVIASCKTAYDTCLRHMQNLLKD
jgi:hypothetical protein